MYYIVLDSLLAGLQSAPGSHGTTAGREGCPPRRASVQVIALGRIAREKKKVSVKTPLKAMKIMHSDKTFLEDIKMLQVLRHLFAGA